MSYKVDAAEESKSVNRSTTMKGAQSQFQLRTRGPSARAGMSTRFTNAWLSQRGVASIAAGADAGSGSNHAWPVCGCLALADPARG